MAHKPAIGRIVHFYQGDNFAPTSMANKELWGGTNGTRIHPAMITRVFSDECVNLIIFLDGTGSIFQTSIMLLPENALGNEQHFSNSGWKWPERVA